MIRVIFALSLWFVPGTSLLVAKDLVQGDERFLVDWSTMTIKFYGEARATADGGDALKKAEQSAWSDAIQVAESSAAKVLAQRHDAGDLEWGKRVAVDAKSFNTVYFADGRVRVYLKKSLASALRRDDINFIHKVAASDQPSKNTGIILDVAGASAPLAHYRIVNEAGQVLFGPENIAEKAYRSNLMGRWYPSDRAARSSSLVGSNASIIKGKLIEGSRDIQVSDQAWKSATEGNEALLQAAKIALIIH